MTQQFWSEFLELYKENSCLWDIHSSSYLRRDLRNAAYNILLEKYRELDPIATLDMVKKKIDVFRTGFRREQRKINEQNLMPGAEYKPTLWYYDLLSFLNYQDFDSTQRISNISMLKECNESDDQNAEATIEYIDIPDDYSTPNPVTQYRLKKRKLEAKASRARSDAAASSCSHSETEEDDCSTYCASLKHQMRDLDREQKYIAQKLISDVIFLARTSQLTLDSSINAQPF